MYCVNNFHCVLFSYIIACNRDWKLFLCHSYYMHLNSKLKLSLSYRASRISTCIRTGNTFIYAYINNRHHKKSDNFRSREFPIPIIILYYLCLYNQSAFKRFRKCCSVKRPLIDNTLNISCCSVNVFQVV